MIETGVSKRTRDLWEDRWKQDFAKKVSGLTGFELIGMPQEFRKRAREAADIRVQKLKKSLDSLSPSALLNLMESVRDPQLDE